MDKNLFKKLALIGLVWGIISILAYGYLTEIDYDKAYALALEGKLNMATYEYSPSIPIKIVLFPSYLTQTVFYSGAFYSGYLAALVLGTVSAITGQKGEELREASIAVPIVYGLYYLFPLVIGALTVIGLGYVYEKWKRK